MKYFRSSKYMYFLVIMSFFSVTIGVSAQQKTDNTPEKSHSHADCPMMKDASAQTPQVKTGDHSGDSDHQAMVMKNGETEMGFSQTETTHHFLIMKDGGAIQVEANSATDTSNRNKIRSHLKEIAQQFADGIFTTPFAVHGQVPPGVPEMDQLKQEIKYKYEETKNGARVRISTGNQQALAAIHQFLKFQIEEHQTRDRTDAGN